MNNLQNNSKFQIHKLSSIRCRHERCCLTLYLPRFSICCHIHDFCF